MFMEKTNNPKMIIQEDISPRLVPNPTGGRVAVADYNGVVMEIVVLDMNGRRMAVYSETDSFDITNMPSGMYIIRVRTKCTDAEERVHYLKLIKK